MNDVKEEISIIDRPQYHFTVNKGWINDPNGLVYYQGKYHLYYQFNPYSNNWDTMHWGHAVSVDLLHWRECGVALYPDRMYDSSSGGGCFSGSVVEYEGQLYAFYTGVSYVEGKLRQTICLAVSDDGYNFTKVEENPLIFSPNDSSLDFRDPKVIKSNDEWWMVCGGSTISSDNPLSRGLIYLYRSRDLFNWTYCGILYKTLFGDGTMIECPDLFRLGNHWVLTFSPVMRTDFKQNYYLVGQIDFEACIFYIEKEGVLDYGTHYYAAQTYSDRIGNLISIGWLGGWPWMPWVYDHGPSENNGYRGILSIPRKVSLDKDLQLCFLPYTESNQFPLEYISIDKKQKKYNLQLPSSKWLQGIIYKPVSELDVLLTDPNMHSVKVGLNTMFNCIIEDFTNADCYSKNGLRSLHIGLSNTNRLDFQLIRDGNVIEIFVDQGRVAFTTVIYPNNRELSLSIILQ